jgi:hypothetical protein
MNGQVPDASPGGAGGNAGQASGGAAGSSTGGAAGEGGAAGDGAGNDAGPSTGDDAGPALDAGSFAKTAGIWDLPGLMRIRDQAASGPLKPAYDAAIKDADKAVLLGPFSVMDKTKTPPSGDKHDYMSLARYYWPDPQNPGGPYIHKDGQSNREISGDGFDWQRKTDMGDAVTALGLGYFLTGNEKYAQRAKLLLETWFIDPATRMNPNFNYAQGYPGLPEGGRAEGVIDGLSFAFLLDAVELLRGSAAMTPSDYDGLSTWMTQMLDWLRTSTLGKGEESAGNNHGTWYDVQATRYAIFVGNASLANQLLTSSKQRRIAAQIQPDGQQPAETARTNGYFYSLYNLTALFDLAMLGQGAGVELFGYETSDGRGIRKAFDFMVPYVDPNKTWPYQQIDQPPPREMFLPLLRRASTAYKAANYEQVLETTFAAALPPDITELVYPK